MNGERWLDGNGGDDTSEVPESFDFKKRIGTDKKICDEIIKMIGGPFLQSWVEETNSSFIDGVGGSATLITPSAHAAKKVHEKCELLVQKLGYTFLTSEVKNGNADDKPPLKSPTEQFKDQQMPSR